MRCRFALSVLIVWRVVVSLFVCLFAIWTFGPFRFDFGLIRVWCLLARQNVGRFICRLDCSGDKSTLASTFRYSQLSPKKQWKKNEKAALDALIAELKKMQTSKDPYCIDCIVFIVIIVILAQSSVCSFSCLSYCQDVRSTVDPSDRPSVTPSDHPSACSCMTFKSLAHSHAPLTIQPV